MSKKCIYYTKDSYGNRRYETFLTSEAKKLMRNCKNTGRQMTKQEKIKVFGSSELDFRQR